MALNLSTILKKKFPDAFAGGIIKEHFFIDTGIETLNYLISGKISEGLNLNGHITTIFGVEGSSKSTIAVHIMGEAMRKYNAQILYLDTETSLDANRLKQFGVDPDSNNLLYCNPATMEESFKIIEDACKEKIKSNDDTPFLIVWDSVSATSTEEESSRDTNQIEMATQAKVLTRNLRRLRPLLHRLPHSGCILISQARMTMEMYSTEPIHPTGGKALAHEAITAIRVSKSKPNPNGQTVKLVTTKNKLFSPYQEVILQLDYSKGFTQEARIESFCELLKKIDLIGSSGAWSYLSDDIKNIVKEKNMNFDADKKFYLKDFAKQLIENKDFYKDIVILADEYIKRNQVFITDKLKDEQLEKAVGQDECYKEDKSEDYSDPYEELKEDMK